jgi:hypothetical protein
MLTPLTKSIKTKANFFHPFPKFSKKTYILYYAMIKQTCCGKGVNKNGGWKGVKWKIKYTNSGGMVENGMQDNYRFILPMGASHFRSVSKTVSIPKDLGRRCDWRTCCNRRGILDVLRKFYGFFLAALAFLSLPTPLKDPSVDFRAFSLNAVKMDLTLSWMGS